jgi:hypothetical protein
VRCGVVRLRVMAQTRHTRTSHAHTSHLLLPSHFAITLSSSSNTTVPLMSTILHPLSMAPIQVLRVEHAKPSLPLVLTRVTDAATPPLLDPRSPSPSPPPTSPPSTTPPSLTPPSSAPSSLPPYSPSAHSSPPLQPWEILERYTLDDDNVFVGPRKTLLTAGNPPPCHSAQCLSDPQGKGGLLGGRAAL